MKKLLTALATAATAALGFAEITGTEGFEGSSYRAAYDNNKPSQEHIAYPFDGYGDYYGSLDDDGDEELLAHGASCVDAVMQFKYADVTDEFDGDVKLVVFANSAGKLVVVDADATNVTTTAIAEDTWYRLTIVSVDETVNFKVYVNGVLAEKEGDDSSSKSLFTSRVADSNSVATMTLSGTGKVDNFVARTTDPFGGEPTGWIANIGTDDPEQYFTDYTEALKAALLADAKLTFADGVTEMDGTAAHPFEIRSAADLKALQAAVADGNGADKFYVQTADIALTEAWPGIGVQNGKDLVSYTVGTKKGEITQEEADRRDAKWSAGAFKGTYDGGNYTISNFQMVGVAGNPDSTTEGLDYCGFFNSVDGATIKNLKIQYAGSLFATDTTASTKESGATFVGVAKNSTLQNLTSLEGTVSCSKGFGGIVGYTTSGTTVDSCTNNVNMTSLANNKCGGIAMITQTGAAVTIRNCQNNGTTAGKATEKGGIVGYVGVATTIDGCSDTAGSTPSILHNQGQTVTVSGVITAPAGVLSYTTSNNNAIDGLDFATVDNDVATFVKAADLVDNGEYVVMGPKAAYAFTQAGTISFDQSLATATVTADTSALILSSSAVDTDTTLYTAVAGVASVGGQAYATMQDAFDAVTAQNNKVTLLSDLTETVTLNPNETVTITLDPNNHNITTASPFASANGIVLGGLSDNGDGTWSMNVINNKASTWTGTAGDELWATASNWSTGVVPGEYTTVTFNDDGRVRIASNYDVVSVAGLVVNAAVTFSETNIDYSKYPAVKICGGNVTGTGKLTLERCGINGNNGAVTVDCDLAFANDTVAGGNIKDSFIQNGTFTINGDVTGTGYLKVMTGTTFNGAVTLTGDTYAMICTQAAPTFNGAVTLGDNGNIEFWNSAHLFGEDSTLAGTGRLVFNTVLPSAKLAALLKNAEEGGWAGTCELYNQTRTNAATSPSAYGNVNSTVCFNKVTFAFANDNSGVKAIEVGAGGLTLGGNYSNGTFTFPCQLTGSGDIVVNVADSSSGTTLKTINFTGDVSGFAGGISFGENANARVYFGANCQGNGKCISVGPAAAVTVASGKTWTAPAGFVISGEMTVDGTLSSSYPLYGSGTVRFNAAAGNSVASSWTGTYVIGWTHESGALNLNDYGNAKSTVKIAADVTGGYIGNGGSTSEDKTYTIAPAIELAANVKLTSGWGTGTKNSDLTTFPMLKGGNDKTLTLWGTGYTNLKTYYKFTALDGFGGTIAINNRAYATIETIKVAQTPAVGAKVANITIVEGGTLEDPSSITVKVGDEVQDVTLEFKADGAEGSGLYVAEPPVEIDPSDVVINYNCYATLSVTGGSLECATYGWTMYTNGVACSSMSGPVKISSGKTTATVKVYSETTAFDNVVAKVAITNGEDVIEREATITVADVAAKIGETEYTKAQLDNAIADAISSGEVLEHYLGVSTTISKGQTLKTKKLAERNGSATVKAAASTTAGEAWTIAKTEEDGVITWSVGTETAYFEFTSADSQTVEYLASPKNAAGVNKLLSDATITKQFSVTKDGVVLDLNGHALTSTYASTSAGAFYVNVISPAPAALTVKDSVGGGSIAAASAHSVFMLGNNGQLTVEGGSFTGKHIVYGSKTTSAATITGGTFEATDAGFTLNMLDSARGTITVTGGTFTGFNPANNSAEGAGTNFVPNGYVSTETSTGVWTVSKSAGGFPGGSDGKTFTIDTAVQAALAEKIPEGKTLADPVEGKTSGVTYAQAYALGLLDEETGDVAKDVTSTIEIVDGKVVVSLDATAKAGYTVMLNVYEKSSLTAQWPTEPTKRYVLGSEEEFTLSEGGSGFYKVGVTIEDAASGN